VCGRYTLATPGPRLAEAFEADAAELRELRPRYNIAPSQDAPVVRSVEGGRRLELRRWGLVPAWSKDPKIGNRLINARAETVAEKPSFRAAFKRGRCLVPADGFYEWKPAGKRKQPYHVRRPDGGVLALAGLVERWHRGEEDEIRSFTILTTDANDLMRPIHGRMPVILPPDDWEAWLGPETSREALEALLRPAPEDVLEAVPVSTAVNDPATDDRRCVEPLADDA